MDNKSFLIDVSLGERSYKINFAQLLNSQSAQSDFTNSLAKYSQAVWITNDNVYKIYQWFFDKLNISPANNNIIIIPDGEEYKNCQILETIMAQLLSFRLDRKSVLVAFGGGVIGDISGLASALYQRGINIVQIPTTLLSMVDSSVGGKTAVNHQLGKNMIGIIKQPNAVFIDSCALKTLPSREFAAGMAEVIKYGLLGDKQFFEWLITNFEKIINHDDESLKLMINKCCQMKANIVERDENEQGERALLNLGHTFAHAIEAITQYKKYLHGEAVAIGMIIASRLSVITSNISEAEFNQIKQLITKFNLPTTWQHGFSQEIFLDKMLSAMAIDKKNQQGKLRLITLNKLCEAEIRSDINTKLIEQAMSEVCPN